MSEFLINMNKWADELEARLRNVRAAAKRHDEEKSDESFSDVRLAISYLKPVVKVMKFTLKTSNALAEGREPQRGEASLSSDGLGANGA